MTEPDQDTLSRAMRVRQLMNDRLRNMTPQERDRLMQIHLAQARGTIMNAYLLRAAMNFGIRIRAMRAAEGRPEADN